MYHLFIPLYYLFNFLQHDKNIDLSKLNKFANRVSDSVEMYVNYVDLKKNQVPIQPRTYKNNLLNLLKSSIPDISTSM